MWREKSKFVRRNKWEWSQDRKMRAKYRQSARDTYENVIMKPSILYNKWSMKCFFKKKKQSKSLIVLKDGTKAWWHKPGPRKYLTRWNNHITHGWGLSMSPLSVLGLSVCCTPALPQSSTTISNGEPGFYGFITNPMVVFDSFVQ